MTRRGAELFERLAGKIAFVPVTTRSLEQYGRIVFPGGFVPEYAVADNGANLLINGRPDPEWFDSFKDVIEESMDELRAAEEYLKKCPETYFDIRLVDGVFLFTKVRDPQRVSRELAQCVMPVKTAVFVNGDKLYVVPKGISKENALKKLRLMLRPDITAAAGDSLFDAGMLAAADIAVIKNGELSGMRINSRSIAETEGDDPDFVLDTAERMAYNIDDLLDMQRKGRS